MDFPIDFGENVVPSETGTVVVDGTSVGLTTGSPVFVVKQLDFEETRNFVDLYIDFVSQDEAHGVLTVSVDGELVSTIDERFDDERQLRISLPPLLGLHQLSFRLDPITGTDSSIEISNVCFGSASTAEVLRGDLNGDGAVDLLDVAPFVDAITASTYSFAADVNGDGEVNLLDIAPFVEAISS